MKKFRSQGTNYDGEGKLFNNHSGAVLAGCAVEHMNLTLHNARTAGMELTETSSTVVETAVEAVQ